MNDLYKKITIILFAVSFAILPAATFALMPKGTLVFSENENRYLSRYVKPVFAGKNGNIQNRRFMNAFDDWFADRFAFREKFIVLKNRMEQASGKTEINGVFTVGDRLIQVWRDYDGDLVDKSLEAMDAFAARYPDKSAYFLLAPTSQEIYADLLPPNCEIASQKNFIRSCYESLGNVAGIDALTPLYENRDKYVYFRTDHHWAGYGAYLGYRAVCGKMGLTPYEYGWFDIEHASNDFRGTLYSKTLDSRVTPDTISFYTLSESSVNAPLKKPPALTLTVNTGTAVNKYDSLYFREYLTQKDKYSAFLGSNSPIMDIVTDSEAGNSLLIIKDSYAHSLIPFLSNHYARITVLDMRYINADIRMFVDPNDYGQILFIYNAINFSEDKNLVKLNFTR